MSIMNVILYFSIYTRVLNSELEQYISTSYTNKELCEAEPILMKLPAFYSTQTFS
jgi:hypothetical protein